MDHNDPHYMHRLQNVLQYLIQNPISAPDVISALAGWLVTRPVLHKNNYYYLYDVRSTYAVI
jgi:ABC-type spermidine/putrescine transport system permease subunit II